MDAATKHKLQQMLDALQSRDEDDVLDRGPIQVGNAWELADLANCRSLDALRAITCIAKYIMDRESQEHQDRQ